MTNEEAIKFANCLKNNYTIDFNDMADFCDTAIKALNQPTSDDCVSREDVKQFVEYIQSIKDSHNTKGTPINFGTICDLVIRGWKLMDLPPVTPIHGTCKDCKHWHERAWSFCDRTVCVCEPNHYCADFEKRGNENDI